MAEHAAARADDGFHLYLIDVGILEAKRNASLGDVDEEEFTRLTRPPPVGRFPRDGRHRVPMEDRLRRPAPAPASLLSCRPDPAKVEMPSGLSLPLAFGMYTRSDRVRSVSLLPERKRQFAKHRPTPYASMSSKS